MSPAVDKQSIGDQIARLLGKQHPMEAPKRRRARRRAALAQTFTRFLAHKPIGPEGEIGKVGAQWRRELASWQQRFADARADASTLRLGRRAWKAERAAKRRSEVRAMRKVKRKLGACPAQSREAHG